MVNERAPGRSPAAPEHRGVLDSAGDGGSVAPIEVPGVTTRRNGDDGVDAGSGPSRDTTVQR